MFDYSLYSQVEKTKTSSKLIGRDRLKEHRLGNLREVIRVTEDAKSYDTRKYEQVKLFVLYLYIFLFCFLHLDDKFIDAGK